MAMSRIEHAYEGMPAYHPGKVHNHDRTIEMVVNAYKCNERGARLPPAAALAAPQPRRL